MSERIQEKRNIELSWLWKLKVGRITFRSACLLYHMLGVRDYEWDHKVSVALCYCFIHEELKVLQLHDPHYCDVGHIRHLYCHYEARAYRCV